MECHKCLDYMKHAGNAWEKTPCFRCQLREDSNGTLQYCETRIENSTWDHNRDDEEPHNSQTMDPQCPQPFDNICGEDIEDPKYPLSKMVSAMSLWLSLSLPARKTIQMRMINLPYSEIGKRLGISRQAAEKAIAKAIAREPLLQNLLPAKSPRDSSPLTVTHKSAVADVIRRSGCRKKKSK